MASVYVGETRNLLQRYKTHGATNGFIATRIHNLRMRTLDGTSPLLTDAYRLYFYYIQLETKTFAAELELFLLNLFNFAANTVNNAPYREVTEIPHINHPSPSQPGPLGCPVNAQNIYDALSNGAVNIQIGVNNDLNNLQTILGGVGANAQIWATPQGGACFSVTYVA